MAHIVGHGSKKRGVGAATKGFGAVSSESTQEALQPVKVDVNFDSQKKHGSVPIPPFKRVSQPTG